MLSRAGTGGLNMSWCGAKDSACLPVGYFWLTRFERAGAWRWVAHSCPYGYDKGMTSRIQKGDGPAACDALFKALSDGTRRALLEHLVGEGEHSVHALTAISGVSQPMVSRHMAKLKRAGLVTVRRAGRETFYAARVKGLGPVVQWMAIYGALWSQRFVALEGLELA